MHRLVTPQRFVHHAAVIALCLSPLAPSPLLAQQPAAAEEGGLGAEKPFSAHIDFDYPDAPPATVEVDLGPGVIHDSLGLIDAAIAGALEGVEASSAGPRSENMEFASEQINAIRETTGIAAGIISEVHARLYENLPEGSQLGQTMALHYDQKFQEKGWESVLKVQDGDDGLRVSLVRHSGSIRGVFVCAFDGNEVMLVGVTGDLSPENVRLLTATAVKTAGSLGLFQEFDRAVGEMRRGVAP